MSQRVRMNSILEASVLRSLMAGIPHYLSGDGIFGGVPASAGGITSM